MLDLAPDPSGSCARKVRLFSGLSVQQQDLVGSLARPKEFRKGELIHTAGESTGRLSVVHSGRVKLSRTLPSGRQRTLRIIESGGTIGEYSFITGAPVTEEAEALTDVRLCVFSHGDFADLIAQHPNIGLEMMRDLGERLAHTERTLSMANLDVDARLADYLLSLPTSFDQVRDNGDAGAVKRTVRLPLSKKDVASLLGTTPESFSRAVRRMSDAGMIKMEADLVTLIDAEAMEDLLFDA